MIYRKLVLAAATLSFAAAPVVAQASLERATSQVEGEEIVGTSGILITVLAVAAAVAAIIIIADDDDEPVSP